VLTGDHLKSLVRCTLALALLGGCGHRPASDPWSTSETLAPLLAATIGGADERNGYAIGRLAKATLVGSHVVVADAIARELRVFDFRGTLLNSFGRRGGGPGEHQSLRELWPVGDSAAAVWDPQLQRLTLWTLTGKANVIPADLSGTRSLVVSLVGVLASGQYVFLDHHADMFALRDVPSGWIQDTLRYLFISQSGEQLARYQVLGEREWLHHEGSSWGLDSPVLGSQTDQAVAGDTLVIGNSGDWSLAVVDASGRELRRMGGPHRDVTPPPEVCELGRRRMVDEVTARYSTSTVTLLQDGKPIDLKALAIEGIKKLPAANRLPAWSRLVSTRAGGLWSCALPPLHSVPVCDHWDLELRHVDRVQLPPGVTVQAFGQDVVLLSGHDELDRAVVWLYRLERRTD
jgi:hypothetical protein